jgi:mono/diheme cytochrome c family protein
MIWARSSTATRTATLVPVGVALAAALAWLVTEVIPDNPGGFPVAERAAPGESARLVETLDPVTLEQGRVYYVQLCVACHGVRGDGQGDWAYRVTPRPANLARERTRRRSDAQLYEIISEGLPGTAMIGWKGQLSDRQRRQLVAYVRHLGQAAGRDTHRE